MEMTLMLCLETIMLLKSSMVKKAFMIWRLSLTYLNSLLLRKTGLWRVKTCCTVTNNFKRTLHFLQLLTPVPLHLVSHLNFSMLWKSNGRKTLKILLSIVRLTKTFVKSQINAHKYYLHSSQSALYFPVKFLRFHRPSTSFKPKENANLVFTRMNSLAKAMS